MRTRPGILWLAAAISLAVGAAVAGGTGHGHLVPISYYLFPPPPELGVATIDASAAKAPNCDPKFYGSRHMTHLVTAGINSPQRLGIRMTVLDAPLTLHKLKVQLFRYGQVILETEAECIGCLQDYPVSGPQGGPVFRLDAEAVAAAAPAWPLATEVGLAGTVHDGAWVHFGFLRLPQ